MGMWFLFNLLLLPFTLMPFDFCFVVIYVFMVGLNLFVLVFDLFVTTLDIVSIISCYICDVYSSHSLIQVLFWLLLVFFSLIYVFSKFFVIDWSHFPVFLNLYTSFFEIVLTNEICNVFTCIFDFLVFIFELFVVKLDLLIIICEEFFFLFVKLFLSINKRLKFS